MEKNVGKVDAIVRFSISAVLIVLGFVFIGSNQSIAIGLFVVSVMLVVTSLVGRCGLYKVFGINTCPIDKK